MKTTLLFLLFTVSAVLAGAQNHLVIMVSEIKNSNCISCADGLLTRLPTGSLKEAYEAQKKLRLQHGMIPSIYILKPGKAAVIYEYEKEVGQCRCRVIRVIYEAGTTAQDALDALEREKKKNPELLGKSITIRETWPVDLVEKNNPNN